MIISVRYSIALHFSHSSLTEGKNANNSLTVRLVLNQFVLHVEDIVPDLFEVKGNNLSENHGLYTKYNAKFDSVLFAVPRGFPIT